MPLPDASLGQLHSLWPSLVDDLESINALMPDHVAETIVSDFEECRDELLRRDRLVHQAAEHCAGCDGSMLDLVPRPGPPPELP
jgi:hypothetical protein